MLFLVQPLIARIILPWFGGTSAVWTTCLVFFQVTLLLGYLYAYGLVGRLRPERQALVHLGLLACSLLALPILPAEWWKNAGVSRPALRILGLLAVTVGLPYFTLSSTGPLLQAWYARVHAGKVPYRLYALSNAGSLLALLSYPAVVEPMLRSSSQGIVWSFGYGVFVLCGGAVAVAMFRSAEAQPPLVEDGPKPALGEHFLWIALAACPSALLLAITNHLTQNIAPIPLLWVLPLAIYLFTLIVCFESDRWYDRSWAYPLLLLSVGAMAYFLFPDRWNARLEVVLPVFAAGLFLCCMACHGELAQRRPAARWLTSFYLMLATGGALGGLFVALISPLIFHSLLELQHVLLASVVLVSWILFREGKLHFAKGIGAMRWAGATGVVLTLLYLLTVGHVRWLREQRLVARNFYGSLLVTDRDYGDKQVRYLVNGTIQHGSQVLNPGWKGKPISYYGPNSGVGIALTDRQQQGPVRLGVIGLGSGALAVYGRASDVVRFYEINPLVEKIALSEFTYLKDTPAKVEIAMGDARRSLENEAPENFDVLAVDAFSGDAIPVHLLTREAFEDYFRHLRPQGILAVHISNTYLRLEWVVRLEAQALGKAVMLVSDQSAGAEDPVMNSSDWMLVSGNPHAFDGPAWQGWHKPGERPKYLKLWTDDSSNLLSILH